MPLVREQLAKENVRGDRLVFVDDNPVGLDVNGHKILSYSSFINFKADDKVIVIAVANSTNRELLATRSTSDGIRSLSVRAANAIVMDNVEIGVGAILCPFVTLTSNIRIGRYFHANLYSYVEHDCVIGDYVTFAPAVRCNGNVIIEDHVYIGSGAIIKQGTPQSPLRIGRGAVIGMGAVVTKNVPIGAVMVGNPARQLVGRKKC